MAINFNEEIKASLNEIINRLKEQAIQGNFTLVENLHLTLVFLGEVVPAKVNNIKQLMDKVNIAPFVLTIRDHLGHFKRDGGDIYWLGIDRNNRLFALQKQLSQELMLAGFSIDKREYRPHLTLGRRIILNQQFNQAEFSKLIKPMQIEISKISLMKSERLKGKLTYTEIYAKKLRNDS